MCVCVHTCMNSADSHCKDTFWADLTATVEHVRAALCTCICLLGRRRRRGMGRGRWEAAGGVGMGLHNWENVKAQPADAFELSFTAKHTKAKGGAVRHFWFGFMLLLHDVQRHIQWRWQLVAKSAKTLSTSRASQTICALSLLLSHVLVLWTYKWRL